MARYDFVQQNPIHVCQGKLWATIGTALILHRCLRAGQRVCRHLVYHGPEPYPETIYDKQSALSLGKLPLPMGCDVAKL